MKKKNTSRLVNKKARREYLIEDTIIAGIELLGPEVKSLRLGRGNLSDGFVKVRNGEAFIHNFHIHPYEFSVMEDYDPTRARKLLLNKKEIEKLGVKDQQKGMALVPLAVFLQGNLFKVEIGVGKGKKAYEKRAELKRRDIDREAEKSLRSVKRR